MKKCLFSTFFLVYLSLGLAAQDNVIEAVKKEATRTIKKEADTTSWVWKRGGVFNFQLTQGSLSNWAAGGDNFTLSVNSNFNYYLLYKKTRHSWDNLLDVNLGFIQTTSLGGRKNDDRLDYLSKYGYKMDATGKWYLSGLFTFRSQFFDGYTFSNNVGDFTSTFLSPAYIIVSAGFDYKPTSYFSVFLSPLTSRLTLVMNETLSNKGVYGVPKGAHSINDIGSFATVNFNKEIIKNVTYRSRLDLFSNYKNKPQNIDLFMTNQFAFKISKNFSATYNLDLIYDDDVRLFGDQGTSPALQAKSLIGIGFLKPLNVKRRF